MRWSKSLSEGFESYQDDSLVKTGAHGESEKVEALKAKDMGSNLVACTDFHPKAKIPADLNIREMQLKSTVKRLPSNHGPIFTICVIFTI